MLNLIIRRVGNLLRVLLSKEALAFFRVDNASSLMPYDSEFEEQMEHAIKGMKQYRNTLRHLAK